MRRRSCLLLAGAGLLARPADADERGLLVELHTPAGSIIMTLFLRQAPHSAGAFLGEVAAGDYDGGAFSRVVRPGNDHGSPPISVIQGAARRGLKPAAPVPHESTRQTGLRHRDGTVSLTRDGVGTATGAEFFICVGDQPALDFGGLRNRDGQGFAAFGEVVRGMETVRQIRSQDASGATADAYTAGQILRVPVPILSARVS